MQDIFDAIQNVLANMQAIGWSPWPLLVSVVAAVGIRLLFEEDVLDVNTIEAKRKQGRVKFLAVAVGYAVSVAAYYGFAFPDNGQERVQAFMFSILNAFLGYVAWSAWVIVDPIGRIRDRWGRKKGAQDETLGTGA